MTCCFLGHREIYETKELRTQLSQVIEDLITYEMADTFLFGSKSGFNTLCYGLVTELKEKHPHIKRIYVRAEFPIISDNYRKYLLEKYEDTYYPDSIMNAGRSVYIKRNAEMIDRSRVCLFYYDDTYVPKGRKSGTKIAFYYAIRQKKVIYHFPFSQSETQAAIKKSK